MKKLAALAVALGLAGCAGLSYVVEHYSGISPEPVTMPDDTYRVYDKPAENRMMVTSSIGSSAAQGVGRGLALGLADTTPPGPRFEAAANQYLAEKGRSECKATSVVLLITPQFEVKYQCAAAIQPKTPPLPPK